MQNHTGSEASTLASPMTKAILAFVYFAVYFVSEIGNGFVIYSLLWLKRNRKRRRAMDDFVLNLATTDFLFTSLSLFNCIEYLQDEWKFGAFACKLQGQFMEITYTVSTLTLATISFSRYRAVHATNPLKLLHSKSRERWHIALVWLASFISSLPLFYAYTIVRKEGLRQCTNLNFDNTTRQIYYLLQAIVLFVIPLTIMIVSQHKITKTLRWQCEIATEADAQAATRTRDVAGSEVIAVNPPQPTFSNQRKVNFSTRSVIAERRITKILTWVWIVFTCCWAPFIAYRSLDYFIHVRKMAKIWNQLWYLCQLSVLLNAAINPFLYYRIMNRGLAARTKARVGSWCCLRRENRQVSNVTPAPRLNYDTS